MEVIRLVDESQIGQFTGSFFQIDGESQPHYVQDVFYEEESVEPQYILIDSNNPFLAYNPNDNIIFATEPEDDDDGEIPSYLLDHMYAKKPREPGMEPTKIRRPRNSKKNKEQVLNQLYVHELVNDAPKINIIRQRLPINSSGYKSQMNSSRQKGSGGYQSRSDYGVKKEKEEFDNRTIIFEESQVPSPSVVVTVGGKSDEKQQRIRNISPTYVEIEMMDNEIVNFHPENTLSTDEEDMEDTAKELFPDFPIEESEEVSTLDVDFNDIQLHSSHEITGQAGFNDSVFSQGGLTRQEKTAVVNSMLVEHMPTTNKKTETGYKKLAKKKGQNKATKQREDDTLSISNKILTLITVPTTMNSSELTTVTVENKINSKLVPMDKSEISKSSPLSSPESNKTKNYSSSSGTGVRRSTRPIKTPARLDDMEDIMLPNKRKRR